MRPCAPVGEGVKLSVVWSMTSPASRRFGPGERHGELCALTADFRELRSGGQGCLEVRLPGPAFPLLTLGFRDDHAVMHLCADEESVSLHSGDGTVPPVVGVEVPVMDELAWFSGDFVLSVDHAWDVVRRFAVTGHFEGPGAWFEL